MLPVTEKKPVTDPKFWEQRLLERDARRAMWDGTDAMWDRMERDHQDLLWKHVHPFTSVLDAGCGYGRLLTLMPKFWQGYYLGVDISPDLITKARSLHPTRAFIVADLASDVLPQGPVHKFDLAVCTMLRHMLTHHVSKAYWDAVEANLHKMARRLLILEPEGFES